MSFVERLRWFFLGTGSEEQRARRTVKIVLMLILFAILFWIIPVDRVFRALLTANPLYLISGLALALVFSSLTAFEMEPLTRKQGIQRNLFQILQINLSTKFFLVFSPSTLVGSGIRWYRLAQPEGKVAESLAALAFFRLLEDFLTITIGLSFWIFSGGGSFQVSLLWVIVLLLGIIFVWFLATRASVPIYLWLTQRATLLRDRPLWQKLFRYVEKLLVAVSAYADIPVWDLMIAVGGGISSLLVSFLSALYLARSIGIELTFLQIGWVNAVVLFASHLPFSVADGLGIREVTLIAILPTLGVSSELALAFSFLLFIRSFFLALLGGILEAMRTFRSNNSPSIPEPLEKPTLPKVNVAKGDIEDS